VAVDYAPPVHGYYAVAYECSGTRYVWDPYLEGYELQRYDYTC